MGVKIQIHVSFQNGDCRTFDIMDGGSWQWRSSIGDVSCLIIKPTGGVRTPGNEGRWQPRFEIPTSSIQFIRLEKPEPGISERVAVSLDEVDNMECSDCLHPRYHHGEKGCKVRFADSSKCPCTEPPPPRS